MPSMRPLLRLTDPSGGSPSLQVGFRSAKDCVVQMSANHHPAVVKSTTTSGPLGTAFKPSRNRGNPCSTGVRADRRLSRGPRNHPDSALRRPLRGTSRGKGTAFKPSPTTPLPHRHRRPHRGLPSRRHHQPTRRRLRHPPNHRDRTPRPPRCPSPQRTDGMGRRDPQASSRALRDRIVVGRRRPPVRDRRTDRRQPIPTRRRRRATPTRLDIACSLRARSALSIIERERRAVIEWPVGAAAGVTALASWAPAPAAAVRAFAGSRTGLRGCRAREY